MNDEFANITGEDQDRMARSSLGLMSNSFAVWQCEVSIPDTPSLPPVWREHPYNGRVTALPQKYRERTERITREVIDKYPPRALFTTVARIILVGDLSVYGGNAGGTCCESDAIIAAGRILRHSGEVELVKTIHHEISSLIKRGHESSFPSNQWKELNPKNFHYGQSPLFTKGSSTTIDDKLAEIGFLSGYCQFSLEDDYNILVENIFVSSKRFCELLKQCAPLRGKARLAAQFMMTVDPNFRSMIAPHLQEILALKAGNTGK